MNTIKRRIYLAVVIIIILSIAVGCSSKGQDKQTVKTSIDFNKEGYPIVDKEITLKFLTIKWPQHGDYYNMPVVQNYEKLSNIHIEWEMIPSSSINEKKNLLFASNQLPDAFFGSVISNNDQVTLGSRKQILPLNNLIEEYAPNIKKLLENNPGIKKEITTPDNNIYSLFAIEEWGVNIKVPNKLFVNKTWLDNLGLKNPETTEDYYNVLKAFKEKDPNGNGKGDEIPLTLESGRLFSMFGPWGVSDKIIVRDNKVIPGITQLGYKEGLKFYNRLYKEGLLDSEVFTHNISILFSKLRQKPMGVGSYVRTIDADAGGNYGSYLSFGPLKGPDGTMLHHVIEPITRKGMFTITTQNKYPEITMRWIDYLYSKDGAVEFKEGVKGKQWDRDEQGIVYRMPVPEGKDLAEVRHTACPGGMSPGIFPMKGDWEFQVDEASKRNNNYAQLYLPFGEKEYYPSNLFYTSKQTDVLTSLESTINPYIEEMLAKFITGAVDIDNEWDNYVKSLKNMGLDKLYDIYNEAYKIYKDK